MLGCVCLFSNVCCGSNGEWLGDIRPVVAARHTVSRLSDRSPCFFMHKWACGVVWGGMFSFLLSFLIITLFPPLSFLLATLFVLFLLFHLPFFFFLSFKSWPPVELRRCQIYGRFSLLSLFILGSFQDFQGWLWLLVGINTGFSLASQLTTAFKHFTT